MILTKKDSISGGLIYLIGDTTAAIILGEFSLIRVLGVFVLGATWYAIEIPACYRWIDKKTEHLEGIKKSFFKTFWATAYFNPLWIARHLFFIELFSQDFHEINKNLLWIAWLSFIVNIPITVVANYLIQNKVNDDWRFIASSLFSAIMVVYYAMSTTIFS